MSQQQRWIIFIVICTAVTLLFSWQEAKKAKVYHEWQRQQKLEEARQKAEIRDRIADSMGVARSDGDSTGTVASAGPADSGATGSNAVDDAPLPSVSIRDSASTEVLTNSSRIVISHLGAKVTSWQLLPARYVVNRPKHLADGTTATLALELVPQVGDWDIREWPFELAGGRTEAFNTEMFDASTSVGPAGEQIVTLTSRRAVGGLRATKEFAFPADNYKSSLRLTFTNASEGPLRLAPSGGGVGTGWLGGFGEPAVQDRVHGLEHVIIAQTNEVFAKTLKPRSEPVDYSNEIAWVGLDRKYFGALIVPAPSNPAKSATAIVRSKNDDPVYNERGVAPPHSVFVLSEARELAVGETLALDYTLFVGPMSARLLAEEVYEVPMIKGGPTLTAAAFHTLPWGFGWVRPVSIFLLGLMNTVWELLKNWGLTVILLTIIVKTAVYPLTHWAIKAQAKTMYEQQKIRPLMEGIMAKYKNDPQTRNLEVMKLYREHNVNPLGPLRGCLPMLMQMPVFVGLYVVFDQAVELRGQTFLWIDDLSQPDRLFGWGFDLPIVGAFFNILPVLMAVTQYISMKMMQMPSMGDEMQQAIQKQMVVMMPIMFGFILFQMPAGLMLYWVVSNTWAIGQSYVTKRMVAQEQAKLEAKEQVEKQKKPAATAWQKV